jgi:hypothetical protein
VKCRHEHAQFVKCDREAIILIVSLYVDDLIFAGNNRIMFDEFKHSMKMKFVMTDRGKMRYVMGDEIKEYNKGIFIYEQKYAKEIMQRFGMY